MQTLSTLALLPLLSSSIRDGSVNLCYLRFLCLRSQCAKVTFNMDLNQLNFIHITVAYNLVGALLHVVGIIPFLR